jgi:hypothetical protein
MFVFAIETCGKTVAFTKEMDRIMLDGILNGEREEGQQLRMMTNPGNKNARWDGVSPFTARLATDSEEADYDIIACECDENDICGDGNIVTNSGILFIV